MILYEKKNKKIRRRFYISFGILCLSAIGVYSYSKLRPTNDPVFKDELVLFLPDLEEKEVVETKVQFILPYDTGKKVVDYFDGKTKEVISVVEFEGIYRPSLGVDISNNGESFNVYSASDGVVVDVVNDTLLGNGIKIQSGEYIITYQSLEGITLKKGDVVKQKDILGKSSSNLYQPSLKNHLHISVEKNSTNIDPNSIISFK